MSFNKKSFALYWEYRINSEVKQELTGQVKLALLEENWDLFHNQETFVENLPDKAKEALLILKRGGFRTSDVLRYFSDEAEREIMQEVQNIILPAYEPIACVVEDIEIVINFDWSHPTGQWVIHATDKDRKNDFAKISDLIQNWALNRTAVDRITIHFSDHVVAIADSRQNAIKKGANLLKELRDCLQVDLFYYNRKNGHRKVLLPNDDYTTRLYNLAAQKNIAARSDVIFSPIL